MHAEVRPSRAALAWPDGARPLPPPRRAQGDCIEGFAAPLWSDRPRPTTDTDITRYYQHCAQGLPNSAFMSSRRRGYRGASIFGDVEFQIDEVRRMQGLRLQRGCCLGCCSWPAQLPGGTRQQHERAPCRSADGSPTSASGPPSLRAVCQVVPPPLRAEAAAVAAARAGVPGQGL